MVVTLFFFPLAVGDDVLAVLAKSGVIGDVSEADRLHVSPSRCKIFLFVARYLMVEPDRFWWRVDAWEVYVWR